MFYAPPFSLPLAAAFIWRLPLRLPFFPLHFFFFLPTLVKLLVRSPLTHNPFLAPVQALGAWTPQGFAGGAAYASLFQACTVQGGATTCATSITNSSTLAGGILLLLGAFFGFLDFACVLLKTLCSCCTSKRDAHARFFLVFLAFACTFCGTVVAGGSPVTGYATYAAYMQALNSSNAMGGGFGSAIAATIVQFAALALNLIADCCTKADSSKPDGPNPHHHKEPAV